MHKMPPPSPLPTTGTPPSLLGDKVFYALAVCAFVAFCCVTAVAIHLDNLDDAQRHQAHQAKGWAQFIDSCWPQAYDTLGRVTYITCPVAVPPKGN